METSPFALRAHARALGERRGGLQSVLPEVLLESARGCRLREALSELGERFADPRGELFPFAFRLIERLDEILRLSPRHRSRAVR
jgi:hypothetical protein